MPIDFTGPNWMAGRSNPVPQRDESYANSFLAAVARRFGTAWLSSQPSNPIQELWSRNDDLATSELMTLGDAILKLEAINPSWVKDRVNAAKSRKQGARIGDIFELVGLAPFCCNGQVVSPARNNQPGYDATVSLSNGATIYISMKNFGSSTHEAHFLRYSEKIALRIQQTFKELRISGIGFTAVCSVYPKEQDWKHLHDIAPQLLSTSNKAAGVTSFGNWVLTKTAISSGDGQIAAQPTSYHATILGPFHQNEQQNILSKLDSAAANFEKHALLYNLPFSQRLLFVRLHETAPLRACIAWCEDYIKNNPGSSIDRILLYQPNFSQLQDGTRSIFHCVGTPAIAQSSEYYGHKGAPIPLNMSFLIGRPVEAPNTLRFIGSEGDLTNTYAYQKGDVYRAASTASDGTMMGNMRLIAPGIIEHSVFTINGQTATFSGNFPRSDHLTLFS